MSNKETTAKIDIAAKLRSLLAELDALRVSAETLKQDVQTASRNKMVDAAVETFLKLVLNDVSNDTERLERGLQFVLPGHLQKEVQGATDVHIEGVLAFFSERIKSNSVRLRHAREQLEGLRDIWGNETPRNGLWRK
jgi:hypothetical protein